MITKSQVASILRFIADIFHSGDESVGNIPETPAPAKRRGRPPGSANATPATALALEIQQATAEPEPASAEPAKPAEPAFKGGKTIEQLRELIQPLIKAARGLEVKAILNKFAPADFNVSEDNNYPLSHLATRPEVHADFVSQIEGLLM